jgi:catechol 2,3-dioxygenase-like lactoylglutathione lyase family enzyme
MIDHVSIPVRDLAAAARFYDAALAPLGLSRMVERERTIGFGAKYPEFWLNLRDSHETRSDSGHHVCLRASSEAAVNALPPP